jgi:hypothetical protein
MHLKSPSVERTHEITGEPLSKSRTTNIPPIGRQGSVFMSVPVLKDSLPGIDIPKGDDRTCVRNAVGQGQPRMTNAKRPTFHIILELSPIQALTQGSTDPGCIQGPRATRCVRSVRKRYRSSIWRNGIVSVLTPSSLLQLTTVV